MRKWGLGAKIAVVGGILVLLMGVGLSMLAYINGSDAVKTQAEQALGLQAELAVQYLQTEFEVQLETLAAIAARSELKSMDWYRQQPVLTREKERVEKFLDMGVIDLNGHVRYTDGSSVELGDTDYVSKAFNGQANVSAPLLNHMDDSIMIMYAVPIIDDDQIVGVLVGHRDGTVLSDITDRLAYGERGYTFIFGRDGTVYAHPDRQVVLNQENIYDKGGLFFGAGLDQQRIDTDGQAQVISYRLSDGEGQIIGLAKLADYDWTIGIGAVESDILSEINILRQFMVIITVLFVTVGIMVSIILGRMITKRLKAVQDAVHKMAEGDFTHVVENKSHDEVGQVAEALNKSIAKIKKVISMVAEAVSELNTTCEQISTAAQQVNASVEEVAGTTNQFSNTLEVMDANALDMNVAAKQVSQEASEGEKALEAVFTRMDALRDNTKELAIGVNELGTNSTKIGEIINTISEIADQTNLLALNAAIEAARAGENGRGFAVVADEVRKLAEKSTQATTEIEALVNQIQKGIGLTVTEMNEETDEVEQALKHVSDSGDKLHSILDSVGEIAGKVDEISNGLKEINIGGHEIASVSQQQAASINQVADSVQNLTNMAEELKQQVRFFKIE